MHTIHPTAIIDTTAQVDSDVHVGPYSYIGPGVIINSGCRIGPHVTILKDTTLGHDNIIHSFAALGGDPQSAEYKGETTHLVIGDRNIIHEYATIHRGTSSGGRITTIGSDNYLMAYVHVAHDCHLGSKIRMVNNASLAGHVTVEDGAYISGFVVVHQFCTIGSYSLLTPFSKISLDVLPYIIVDTDAVPSPVRGINIVGLQRAGFTSDAITMIKSAYKLVFRSSLLMEQIKEQLATMAHTKVQYAIFLDGILRSSRGIIR